MPTRNATVSAKLNCEGGCSERPTLHIFHAKDKGTHTMRMLQGDWSEEVVEVHGTKLLYICADCGTLRTWGFE
jgi:hypothetical protein